MPVEFQGSLHRMLRCLSSEKNGRSTDSFVSFGERRSDEKRSDRRRCDERRCHAPNRRKAPLRVLRIHTVWWSQAGSNRRPLQCHCSALPAELWPRCMTKFNRHPDRLSISIHPRQADRRALFADILRLPASPSSRIAVAMSACIRPKPFVELTLSTRRTRCLAERATGIVPGFSRRYG